MANFDQAQREAIRTALLAYMKQHGIGVPRLGDRIKKHAPFGTQIPVKTLQRFLANKFWTNDTYVGVLHNFVQANAQPDSIIAAGEGLSRFYGGPPLHDYSGSFTVYTSGAGVSELTARREANYWRVKEVYVLAGRSVFDGILIGCGYAALFVLKDRLAGLPRTYTVWFCQDRKLRGHGTGVRGFTAQSATSQSADNTQTVSFEITLNPQPSIPLS